MKYEKPEVELVKFDFADIMTSSLPGGMCTGYTDSVGHTCGTYTAGSSCVSWSTPSFGGGRCDNYNGSKCFGYTDGTHDYCGEYGVNCSHF